MKKSTVVLGTFALIFALADLIHGQHDGDALRSYIHLAEFPSFVGFLILLEVNAFKRMTAGHGLNPWLAGICLSLVSFLGGFILFGLSGGSAHGDGGPLAASFGAIGCLGMIGIPMSIIGFLVPSRSKHRN